jgi:hypothetical protein
MASFEKKGIRYFNIDCEQEDNLELVIAKHKMEGYGTLVQLWRKIYRIDGYYCDFKEKNQYLFAKDIGVTLEFLWEVLNTCFEENIFSQSMFEKYAILTSSGVQKRWLRIVKDAKRKDVTIDKKYKLISKTPEKEEETPEFGEETPVVDIQSKVNKSIVNKSKEKYIRDVDFENSVLSFFGFNEIANYDKMVLLSECCFALTNSGHYESFKTQFKSYSELKTQKGFVHSFSKFLGNQKECFIDGAWNAENWMKKLSDEINKKSNVSQKTIQPAKSGFGKLQGGR